MKSEFMPHPRLSSFSAREPSSRNRVSPVRSRARILRLEPARAPRFRVAPCRLHHLSAHRQRHGLLVYVYISSCFLSVVLLRVRVILCNASASPDQQPEVLGFGIAQLLRFVFVQPFLAVAQV